MRVYIAGPMTGLPDNNRAAFAYAWNRLMEAGFDAVSPHFMESAIEVETKARMGTAAVYRHVLPVDIFALSSVDAVLALPGWEQSRGAKFEKHFADLIEVPWVACVRNGDFIPGFPEDGNMQKFVLEYTVAQAIIPLKEIACASS